MFERLRRLRQHPTAREIFRESHVRVSQLIYPVFVTTHRTGRVPIASMPGVAQLSVEELLHEAEAAQNAGLRALLLFGIPSQKDDRGHCAYRGDAPIPRAIQALRSRFPDLYLIADVCLCDYTPHGHCGILNSDGNVANDETLILLGEIACAYADAGANMIAPSDMMDGRIAHIRRQLDHSHAEIPIMAYSSKFASCFYGPFRDAANCAPAFGNRANHQLDPANAREALRASLICASEGADALMVKPAAHYLDVVAQLRAETRLPLAAYQVSGEYAMIKAAAANGWLSENDAVRESFLSIARAGADAIISYYALAAAQGKHGTFLHRVV